MSHHLHAADTAARMVALTALDRTLLVEAGAGSGKTSVLAGRVTSLLAAGVPPREIAAITFSELASGELRARIFRFVSEVAGGDVPPDLRTAFPDGPTSAQRAALVNALSGLDELVCTTIHGFCQRLLTPYPVEAKMDPGASVIDPGAAAALINRIMDAWLRERLSGTRRPDDLLVALFVDQPTKTTDLLKVIAEYLLRHRGAAVPEVETLGDALHWLRGAVQAFRAFLAGLDCVEPETSAIVDELEALLLAVPGSTNEAEILPHLLNLKVPGACSIGSGAFASYRRKGKWKDVLKAAKSKLQADMIHASAADCYQMCCDAHAAVRAYAAGRILQLLAAELKTVLARFDTAKRDAALIDFDDLILKARDLLARQPVVRAALHARFKTILVDEFQDTDRLQCEILWRLCADRPDPTRPWTEWPLRPGALFLVGDPKQAIYRFRGADVRSYFAARDRLTVNDITARVSITQNFRSVDSILDWVNERFQAPLSATGQSGFEALFSLTAAHPDRPAVASLPVEVVDKSASGLRDAEAEAVAACCARIIGALPVRGIEGPRPCRPDDIALLTPVGTELWRYERALEDRGISVSTQAGKGFYTRQEVQDLTALTCTLADARDTLALGALLRGPLVGLTEEQLLDAVGELPKEDGQPGRLFLWTPPEQISLPLLRDTLRILQALAKQASSTTPFVLLCQAVEEMQVRPLLGRRQQRTAERALANVDQFLEGARPFDVSGLLAFAQSMRAQWREAQRTMEARPDSEQQSVSLVTMHSAKGLEWPVVIPVNTGGNHNTRAEAALDAQGRLHLPVFGLHGPSGSDAVQAEKAELDREMHRLWYVATTRARDLLLLPMPSTPLPPNSWMGRLPMRLDDLPPIDLEELAEARLHRTEEHTNLQDRPQFATEAALIAARSLTIRRITPHLAEAADTAATEVAALPPVADDGDVTAAPPRGSLARGLILHKLLEEVLTGEVLDDAAALASRATVLALELDGTPAAAAIDPVELVQSVRRGLDVPDIRSVRPLLVPECAIAASTGTGMIQEVILGVADAVVPNAAGGIRLVVDWKSDVDPSSSMVAHYRAQVGAYLKATGAAEGLIVFLTTGRTEHVYASARETSASMSS
jgi:ATP-dependent exoDNAse (exonuclease V) beta subunit